MKKDNITREVLKKLPSIDSIINEIPKSFLNLPHSLLIDNVRSTLSQIRKDCLNHIIVDIDKSIVIKKVLQNLYSDSFCKLKSVINGTGIILHTGLGRAPIDKGILLSAIDRIYPYSNIELDIESGKRGERNNIVNNMINSITKAEASIVVNNNAAAVLLMLSAISNGKDVIVSRGQLVEIGGSFRIPDVIDKSGSNMVEVGTTNKTHIKDYENSISDKTGSILYAHTSNYRVIGFTKEVDIKEISNLAKRKKVPFMADIGSGALVDLKNTHIPYEKMVKEYISNGVDIVSFSGDKLLGGIQCGIIVGKKKYINRIHKDPMYRALRCDKITFAILDQVLRTYKNTKKVSSENLTHKLLMRSTNQLSSLGSKIISKIVKKYVQKYDIKLEDSLVEVGSGSLPTETLPSKCISFNSSEMKPSDIKKNMLKQRIPIIGYIKNNTFFIDLKAVTNDQIEDISIGINESLI
tara:strand:- start:991 stop:2388 length:1398 start_codon:yes stop_codon:yes gene_type:complete